MIRNEFYDWVKFHSSLFPGGFGSKVAAIGPDTLTAWAEVFASVTLVDAKLASRRVLIESDRPPFNVEDHIHAVKRLCEYVDTSAQSNAFQRRVKCNHCKDQVGRDIFEPDFVAAMLKGVYEGVEDFDEIDGMVYTETTARCQCSMTSDQRKQGFVQYSSRKHCRILTWPVTLASARIEIAVWDSERDKGPVDHSDDFMDAYN